MRSAAPLLLALCFFLFNTPADAGEPESRVFQFSYEVQVPDLPAGRVIDLYIPLPRNNDDQRILEETMELSRPGEVLSEDVHGNRYLHIQRAANDSGLLTANLSWLVERRVDRGAAAAPTTAEIDRYLAPNRLVPVGHEVLDPILAEVRARRSDDSPAATARAIYDWVVDNVEYKKVGTGWGNGDTFWACSERYGNCTDFHALFISLARSEGIPARFEIGFPLPTDREQGEIGGYHCWVKFYLPGRGWVPIDASEAAKHPEMRELLYGTHPADRIHFTSGRDLTVSEATRRQPLNYFIYPHLEVGGQPSAIKLHTRFAFREVEALQAAR